ncbi:MAG: DUF2281 domain-containing protein [Planctomycetota bacterium]
MTDKEAILEEVEAVPDELLEELHDFIQFLKQKAARQRRALSVMSESSLRRDWLRPEEDEAWRDL